MLRFIAIALLLSIGVNSSAQKFKNPQSYFKQFQKENRKLRIKQFKYMESALKNQSEKKVLKMRQLVLDQAKKSKTNIARLGPYDGSDILQKEYIASLDIYIDALENSFGLAEELVKNRYNSYEDLKKYYDAVTKAEDKMIEAGYRLEKAEDHFANINYLTISRDEELEEQYAMLDEVTLYSRDMTLIYFRVESKVNLYLDVVTRKNMDSLNLIVSDIRAAVKESTEELSTYDEFDGNKSFLRVIRDYLEEMEVEIDETLLPLSDALQNEYMDEDEFKDVQKEFKRFVKNRNYWSENFFETKNDLILDYLPEK